MINHSDGFLQRQKKVGMTSAVLLGTCLSSPMVYAFDSSAIDDYLKDFGTQQPTVNSTHNANTFNVDKANFATVSVDSAIETEVSENKANSATYETATYETATSENITSNNLTLSKTQQLLLGVFVNGVEKETLQVLQGDEQYFLPINSLSALTGIELNSAALNSNSSNSNSNSNSNQHEQPAYVVTTPLGTTTLSSTDLKNYQNQSFIEIKTLKKMGITANFNQADLAIYLFMGWEVDANRNQQPQQKNPVEQQPIDYYPSRAGLLSAYFDTNYSQRRQDKQIYQQQTSRVGGFGYLMGGVWGINAESNHSLSNTKQSTDIANSTTKPSVDNSEVTKDIGESIMAEMEVNNLYWEISGDNVASRVGINQTGVADTHASEYTGVALAYSNRDINRYLSSKNADSKTLIQASSQDYQHIKGKGMAGGIAELRINGRMVARVQIALDGEYEFRNLDVSRLDLANSLIEVAIYEYRQAVKPIEVQPINLGKRRSNVATDEVLIEAGIGAVGNVLLHKNNVDDDANKLQASTYTEYGIRNNMVLRGGARYQDDAMAWMAGLNYVPNFLSPFANLDVSYWHENSEREWQADLEYDNNNWNASYQYDYRKYLINGSTLETIDNMDAINKLHNGSQQWLNDQRHSVTVNYRPKRTMSVSANHNYRKPANHSAVNDSSLFASVELNDSLTAGGTFRKYWDTNESDRYTYRLFYNDDMGVNGSDTTVGLLGDNDKDSLSLQHRLNEDTSIGQSIAKWHGNTKLHYLGYVDHQFADNNRINLGYSLFDGQLGWNAYWQYYLRNNGLKLNIGYQHKYVSNLPSDAYVENVNQNQGNPWQNDDYFYAQLRFDGWKPPNRGLKLGKYPSQKNGSVLVEVAYPREPIIDNDQIRFNLDRLDSDNPSGKQQVSAKLVHSDDTHSQYLIKDIKAGEYRLTMDAKNLPFEYSTTELATPRVKVANHAPTVVSFTLKKYYALSGKLVDTADKNLSDVLVQILQEGQPLQTVKTNRFGYFQILGLQSGHYQIKAKGYQSKQVTVTDDHLLNVRLHTK